MQYLDPAFGERHSGVLNRSVVIDEFRSGNADRRVDERRAKLRDRSRCDKRVVIEEEQGVSVFGGSRARVACTRKPVIALDKNRSHARIGAKPFARSVARTIVDNDDLGDRSVAPVAIERRQRPLGEIPSVVDRDDDGDATRTCIGDHRTNPRACGSKYRPRQRYSKFARRTRFASRWRGG